MHRSTSTRAARGPYAIHPAVSVRPRCGRQHFITDLVHLAPLCLASRKGVRNAHAMLSSFFLFSSQIEKLGCGKYADIRPGGRERTTSKGAIVVQLCG